MYSFHQIITHIFQNLKKQKFFLFSALMYSLSILSAKANPAPNQLPTVGNVVAGNATISQNGSYMNINQTTNQAAINWNSFDIGSSAHVNFAQPSNNSVTLNRVLNGNPTQIFGKLTANGHVFLTNAAGVYFSPTASVNVGALIATTNQISNENFLNGRYFFERNGSEGKIINEGNITASLGKYVALLAPEVRNEGVIIAQMGTVALASGENYELQFGNQGNLSDIKVSKSQISSLVENKQMIQAEDGLVILSAQAANSLQGGVVKNSGTIEAKGMVNDGGTVKLLASDSIELGGNINVDADSSGNKNGGTVLAISDLQNTASKMDFFGTISARSGDNGAKGGFVETSGSNVKIQQSANVDTRSKNGKTGKWLIDPYDYTIDASAATAIVNALSTSNVEVSTVVENGSFGSNSDDQSTGNITVNSTINSSSTNELTLTASNAINVAAEILVGSLTLNGPGGISLGSDITTVTDMTLNGNITLTNNITLSSGISDTYSIYTTYVVPTGVTTLTATLVGGAGGKGGNDGGNQGGITGSAGSVTASFNVTEGQSIYIAPGSGGSAGVDSQGNAAGGAGGTNQFGLAEGGTGGIAGSSGSSGGGGGGGAATILSFTSTPDEDSALLIGGGAGGGGGSGNNTACPGLCAGQNSGNFRDDEQMDGATGFNAIIGSQSINDGGASGGGGGGVVGGDSNLAVFFPDEWTGRGGNLGSSGVANGFETLSLSTSAVTRSNSQGGYATISYGGGTIDINGTINGGFSLDISAPNSNIDISGAIGGSSSLTSLSMTGSSGIALSGGSVTTSGTQNYNGPLTLNNNSTTFNTTNNAVNFNSTVLKGSGVDSNIEINSGSGSVSFNSQVGTNASPIGSININNNTGTTSFSDLVYATSLTKSGSGRTNAFSTIRTSTGQSYSGTFNLGGNVTLNNTGAGNIVLNNAISNDTQNNLTITNSNGNVSLLGNLSVGTNARPTPIGDVSITASGTVTLGSSGTPIQVDAKSLSVTSATTNVHASTSSFTCGTGASASGICLTTSALFNNSAASTFSGPLTGTTTLTKSGSGSLTLTGNNTYSGNTTVNAGKLEIGGSGRLGNGSYAGNIATEGQIRFSTSANQTLSGTVSGDGFINSPGSGSLSITTLSNADSYNLITAYVVPESSDNTTSSTYGNSLPDFTYTISTTSNGGSEVNDADTSGTATFSGIPTSTSSVGNYNISYTGGVTAANERYVIEAGDDLAWTILARPLNVTVSKDFDGNSTFSKNFSMTGMVNGDNVSITSGTANVSSSASGTYRSFLTNNLVLNNSNYTFTGGSVEATINADNSLAILIANNPPAQNVVNNVTPQIITSPSNLEVPKNNEVKTQVRNEAKSASDIFNTNSNQNNSTSSGNSNSNNTNQNTSNSKSSTPSSTPKNTNTPQSSTNSNGVVVSLVQTPSDQSKGIVNVAVSKATIKSSNGFSFALPEQVQVQTNSASTVTVKTVDGKNLPDWIKFDPKTKNFVASAIPENGLPLNIIINSGGKETTMSISEI